MSTDLGILVQFLGLFIFYTFIFYTYFIQWFSNTQISSTYFFHISSKDKEIKTIGEWIHTLQNNYKKNIQIMKDPEIRKLWNDFINNDKYKSFFKQ